MAEAVIFVGLQGSGKTTYFNDHFAATHEHVSRDIQGTAEREAALEMALDLKSGATLGADKAYDVRGFVEDLRCLDITPHVAQNVNRRGGSAIDGRTTRHPGYQLSQRARKRIEEPFGWAKTVGGMAQTAYRGIERVRARFILTMAASNLARLPRLLAG